MYKSFFLLLFTIFVTGFADLPASSQAKKSICLNMIVKNERDVICRCLDSVLPLIDYWVIVDTGSTDGTQEIIKKHLQGIPGELHNRPWVNFGHNRNEALDFAKGKGDYILFMDADDILRFDSRFSLPDLTHDFYAIRTHSQGTSCLLPRLIKASLNWRWYDVLHEYILCDRTTEGLTLEGVEYVYISDGFRSRDPKRFDKDIQVLEEAIETDPTNTRYPFYLAISYIRNGNYEKALKYCEMREKMGGFPEEIFIAKLSIAQIYEHLGKPPESVRERYLEAYHFRPSRVEPLYYLLLYEKRQGNLSSAYEVAKQALLVPPSVDAVYVEQWITDYGLLFEYAILSYALKHFPECHLACKLLSLQQALPHPYQESLVALTNLLSQEAPARPSLPDPSLSATAPH